MKTKNILIAILVGIITVSLILIAMSSWFMSFAASNVLLASAVKFFFLASIGDVIAVFLKEKQWKLPKSFLWKALIWGFIGVVIAMMFQIFPNGVALLQTKGLLPFAGNTFLTALMTSLFLNTIFAPTMMAFHRFTDTYLAHKAKGVRYPISQVLQDANWPGFYKIVIFRTIPLFWIPAHTITFLLPEEYRIVFAAFLGICLGLILSLASSHKKEKTQ